MRFYTARHAHSCGIDLHARTMYVCILDDAGEILVHKNIRADAAEFLAVVAPFRDDLVVAVECTFTWYWLADLCAREGIAFVLGHALYMKAIHGGKAKNDRIDAHKIAVLLRGGTLPQAFVYPAPMRSTRDLLRRRLHAVRERGFLLAHIQNTHHQYNLPGSLGRLAYKSNRVGVVDRFADLSVRKSVESDLGLIAFYDQLIRELELFLTARAKVHDAPNFYRLRSIPGVGKILAMTILYEVCDVKRFGRVQEFASYARLIRCAKESAGKRSGSGGRKIGNPHLKWAITEAAVLFLRHADAKQLFRRLQRRHGKTKARGVLAHKLGRTIYFMLRRERPFDLEKFMAA